MSTGIVQHKSRVSIVYHLGVQGVNATLMRLIVQCQNRSICRNTIAMLQTSGLVFSLHIQTPSNLHLYLP